MSRGGVHDRDPRSWRVRDSREHDRRVRRMFARISGVYDFMNHFLSFDRDRAWRRNLAARLDVTTWELLDVCAGTGDLALACLDAGRAREAYCADFCPEMLAAGAGKRAAGGAPPTPLAADTQSLPFLDSRFDAVVAGFGMRNLADVRRGVAEARRVLRPGGQLLVLEFFRDDPGAEGEAGGVPRPIRWYLNAFLPLLGKLFGRNRSAYAYLAASMGRFLSPAEFAEMLEQEGFGEVFIERQTFGIAHIVGGRLP